MLLKKIKWKNIIIALIIAILLIVLAVKTVSYAINNKDDAINTTIEETVSDTNLYKNFDLSIEKKESSDFTSSIILPKTNIKKVDKEIIDWAGKIEKDFYKDIKKKKKKSEEIDEDFRAHLNIQTEVLEVTNDLATIILNVSKFTDEENMEDTIKPFIVSLEKEKIVKIDELFDFKELNSENHLYKLVDSQLKKDEAVYESIDQKTLNKILNKPKDVTWGLNKTQFLLYFQEDEIASKSIGTIAVNIPIENFNKHMDKQLAEDMNVEEIIQIAKEKEEKRKREIEEKKKEEERKKQKKEEERKREIAEKKKEEEKKKERKENLKDLDSTKKYVAITFDDGPSSDVTPRILNYLDEYDAVATFYMLGSAVKAHPTVAKDVANRGHEIASHSLTHADLTSVGPNQVNTEFSEASSIIEQTTGVKPETFRPPYGEINQNVTNKATEMNQPIILWSVDSYDWKLLNAGLVYSTIINKMHPGAIVLLHDIHPTTADALPNVLKTLKDQGYEFVTVTDLLQLTGEEGIGPYNNKK